MSEPTTDELVAMLASMPDQLEAALTTSAAASKAVSAQPNAATGEDSWTTSEIVGHLCDAARYWGGRMRRAIYEDNPQLEMFDQDAFVRLAAYRYTPTETLAREFRLVSQSNVTLLRELSPEQWERVGIHSQRGPLSVRAMVAIEAGHELDHVRRFAEGS